MADYFDSEGAFADPYTYVDYSNNYFSYQTSEQFVAHYFTRYANAIDHSVATMSENITRVDGYAGADQVLINSQITGANSSVASSYSNHWSVSLGDGDDAGVIHTLASGVGFGTEVSVSWDNAWLGGGSGADVLHSTQYLGALNGASVSIDSTVRFINGGDGYDSINAQARIESGRSGFAGGSANYSNNHLYVNAGADGADVNAQTLISSSNGGAVNANGNHLSFGGANVNAGTSIEAGNFELAGGTVGYSGNSVSVVLAPTGGNVFAQNYLLAAQGGAITFTDNLSILVGDDGADFISAGIGIAAGSTGLGMEGGAGEVLNNSIFAGGFAGSDVLDFFLTGWSELGGSAVISGNYFYGEGGDGDDNLNLNWWTHTDGSTVEISGNSAHLQGDAGSDTINAYLGDGVSNSSITLLGGDGDDVIQSIDFGQGNERLISGGAGNDTIVDNGGFTTVVFEGGLSDYTLTALSGGWISVVDNRDGSPDGADQLYRVDQVRFSDGDFLIADLNLPIEGTEGDDVLVGGPGDDIIHGYGGNDRLRGDDGDDLLDGGAGNDILTGLNGNDTLMGGDGNDQLIGSRGADLLTGGAGADTFVFGALSQSTPDAPDLITDFSGQTVLGTNGHGNVIRVPGQGDQIDLSFLDADTSLAGDQAFTLVQHGFSGTAGEVYSSRDANSGMTFLFLDVDGDAAADMSIQLLGQVSLTGADFIL